MQEFGFDGALLYDQYDLGVPGDLEFYVEEAVQKQGHVLEIGAGTGRILIPIAEKGVSITGLDRSKDMLDIAQQKVSELPEDVQNRIMLYEGDMQSFKIPFLFDLIIIPHRAFLHMLTPQAQRQALRCMHRHLKEDGRLVFNVIDPTVEEISAHLDDGGAAMRFDCRTHHPETGNTVLVWYSRQYFPANQRIEQLVVFEELDQKGRMISKSYTPIVARYTHRHEMEHLLELCDFEVEHLYGGFYRQPWRYGEEQVWVVKKRGD